MSCYPIGIDLGTAKCCAAVFKDNVVQAIPTEHGHPTMPSYVAFTKHGVLIGKEAREQIESNPENTVFDMKLLIGRKITDSSVKSKMKLWPFKVVSDHDSNPKVQVRLCGETKEFTPGQIVSMLLRKIRDYSETFLGNIVRDVVISIPSYFNHNQRQAIRESANIAGLNVICLVSDPTLAAIAYGKGQNGEIEKKIFVFNFGSGFLNASILSIENDIFEVKAVSGDNDLGGNLLVNRIMNSCIQNFKRRNQKNIDNDANILSRLKNACEEAMRSLSTCTETTIQLDSLFDGIDFNMTISRALFEEMCVDLLKQTMETIEKLLRDAKMNRNQIDEVVLVGGSTRIPKQQQILHDFFNGKLLNKSLNSSKSIAHGAAIYASVCSMNTSESIKDVLVLDVTPFSIGYEGPGGVMTAVIKRNSTFPISSVHKVSCQSSELILNLYEGERSMVKDNRFIGEFHLGSLPSGVSKVDVRFEISVDQMISVINLENYEYNAEENQRIQMKEKLELQVKSLKEVVDTESKSIQDNCDELLYWISQNPKASMEEMANNQNKLTELIEGKLEKIFAASEVKH